MSYERPLFCLLLVCFNWCATGQQLDSNKLESLTDEQLLRWHDSIGNDSIKQEQLARLYLKRARENNDTIKMARGYQLLAYTFSPRKNIAFADSLIALTTEIEHITYPAMGYLIKAYEYYGLRDLRREYQSLLKADKLAKDRNNIAQQMYISGSIVSLQAEWGDKQKALERQLETHALFDRPDYMELLKKSTRAELHHILEEVKSAQMLNSFTFLIVCYYQLEEFERANTYLDLMEAELNTMKAGHDIHYQREWIAQNRVELLYWLGCYPEAINGAQEVLQDKMQRQDNYGVKAMIQVQGLSQLSLGQNDQALELLKQADSIYQIRPNDDGYKLNRLLLDALYEEHKRRDQLEKAIVYLDRIIALDSLRNAKAVFLEPALVKDFETPKLLEEKEHLIAQLNSRNQKLTYWQWTLLVMLLVSLGWGLNYYRKQRLYRKRFEQMMQATPMEIPKAQKVISSDQEREIVQNLELFVESQGYLDNQLNLQKLAKKLETNANYLSKVINAQFGKNLSQFLHDLRVEYAKNRLLRDPKFRLFTVKAIAEESGYRNAESFSSAFHKRHRIYPSYYIRQLGRKEELAASNNKQTQTL